MASAEAFLEMMAVERGASPHTLDAYRRDLADYESFLARRGGSVLSADLALVRAWLGQLSSAGMASATMARRLSAVRQFHRFLFLEGARGDDPTQAVEGPRQRRPLPKLLERAEIEALIAAARRDPGPQGVRLVACLELLYATGLRVSELLALPLSALAPDRRFLTVLGKGGKERMVPVGRAARRALAAYLAVRDGFIGGRGKGRAYLFPSRSAKGPPHPPASDPAAQGAGARRRHRSGAPLAACAAPCLRQPPARGRRRSARRPADARPRRHCDHPDLHPCTGRPAGGGGGRASPARQARRRLKRRSAPAWRGRDIGPESS